MTCPRDEQDWLVPVRGLNEFVYCPRLFHLMYVQGLFSESVETIEGQSRHQKPLAKGKAVASESEEEITLPWSSSLVREMMLCSESLRIVGKYDVILESEDEVIPVEVKHGPAPDGTRSFSIAGQELSAVAWDNDQIQIAAQMAMLRENGYPCRRGRLYYHGTRTLAEIPWSDELHKALASISEQARLLRSAEMPEPLMDSNKCIRCSLNHICLPDETLCLKKKLEEPRQLYPGRDDTGVLHIVTPGTHVGKSGDALKIAVPGEKEVVIPMKDVAHLCVWGNAQVTTQAVLDLADRGVGISWLSGGGWLRAVTTAPLTKNVGLRREQYRLCDDPDRCLRLAKWIVEAKIENQRVLLRRNGDEKDVFQVLTSLKERKKQAGEAETTMDMLRGIEGNAAREYWSAFPSLLKAKEGQQWKMDGRNRRPPKDPVNALLSFGYTLLLRDFMTALHGVGLDALCGFYHAVVPGRPALALDLMEPFRPLVVDSAVLRAINEGSFSPEDFVQVAGSCILKPHARRRWIEAYERRVDEMVTHPLFGYRLSYRRIFTLEARLLGRYMIGEIPEYHPMTTK